jgi:hypothetical protein
LVDAGYLTANAARGVTPGLKLPRATINKRRSFNEAQWALVMEVLGALPDTAFTRRNRLILELEHDRPTPDRAHQSSDGRFARGARGRRKELDAGHRRQRRKDAIGHGLRRHQRTDQRSPR